MSLVEAKEDLHRKAVSAFALRVAKNPQNNILPAEDLARSYGPLIRLVAYPALLGATLNEFIDLLNVGKSIVFVVIYAEQFLVVLSCFVDQLVGPNAGEHLEETDSHVIEPVKPDVERCAIADNTEIGKIRECAGSEGVLVGWLSP